MSKWAPPYLEARYTDGTPVKKGDHIRYKQQSGGILPAGDWRYGVADNCPHDPTNTLYMKYENPDRRVCYAHIFSHIVERAGHPNPE